MRVTIARIVLLSSCTLWALHPTFAAEAESASPRLARFVVDAGELARSDTPVCASLDGLPSNRPGHVLELHELVEGKPVPVASQVDADLGPRVCWILAGSTAAGTKRTFELVQAPAPPRPVDTEADVPAMRLQDDGASLTILRSGHPVLAYRYRPIPPPEGASPLYERGGFIHPLWSPAGAILTRVQPPDHYHHVGIWNPWTRTDFEGREIDFWNLHSGQGTVRSSGVVTRVAGDVLGGFVAQHAHVDLSAPDPTGARTALNELWRVRAWNVGRDTWLIDFTSALSCATASPLTIKAYRYQGFGFRAVAEWDDATATLLTSEGKDKSNGNATRARWCDVRGPTAQGGTAGIVFMAHPGNRDSPELLRIWPTGTNEGKENVFINFNPAQEHDWVLEPDQTYALRYRMLVYDGATSPALAEQRWTDFAHPPRVTRE